MAPPAAKRLQGAPCLYGGGGAPPAMFGGIDTPRRVLETVCRAAGRQRTELVADIMASEAIRRYRLVGRANTRDVVRQLTNYLEWRFNSLERVCLLSATTVGFDRRFIPEAGAIGMRLLLVPNPQSPALRLSFELLYLIREAMMSRRLDCRTYLVTELGLDLGTADSICAMAGGLVNFPPPQGVLLGLPWNFVFDERFLRLAREALDYLIQPPPPPPMVTRLPSIQIAPPMR